jgi:hypothetical protein
MQCVTLKPVLTNQRYELFYRSNETCTLNGLQTRYSCVEASFFRRISTAVKYVSHYLYYVVHEYLRTSLHHRNGCRAVTAAAILFSHATGKTQEAARHCVQALLSTHEEYSLQTCHYTSLSTF